MNWSRLIVGVCALAIFFAGLAYYVSISSWEAQEQVLEQGNVQFGTEIQGLVDDFKGQFGRYPTSEELTNLFVVTIYAGSLTLTSNLDSSGRWYYNEKSGEVRINSHRLYDVGLISRIDLFNTDFRRPTKVEVIDYFGKTEIQDCTLANDRMDSAKSEIVQVMTNWYMTNRWR